jgi:hypothetical protein
MFSSRRVVQSIALLTVSPLRQVLVGIPLVGLIARALFLTCNALPGRRDGVLVPLAFAASHPVFLILSRTVSRKDLGYFMAVVSRGRRPSGRA